MEPKRLRKLTAQLNSRLPLVGALLQRRAAQALAQDASPPAIQALAYALANNRQEAVRQVARQALHQVQDQPARDAVCAAWAATRHPELAELLQRRDWVASAPPEVRTLSALLTGRIDKLTRGSAEIVAPLIQACNDRDPALAELARLCLPKLQNPGAVEAFCAQWAATREPLLEAALLQGRYLPGRPPGSQVLSALKTGQPEALQSAGAEIVLPLAQACRDRDPEIAADAQAVLPLLRNSEAQEAVCHLFIERDEAELQAVSRQAVLAGGYLPREPHRRALLLFLTEQWEPYAALDFDGRLLRAAYEAVGSNIRRRIREQVRLSGRIDLLTVIAGGNFSSRIQLLTPDETSFLVQMLVERQEWAKLWTKVFELPLEASLAGVRALAQSGWQPAFEDGQAILVELSGLASAEIEQSGDAARRFIPPAVRRAHARVPGGRINALAFSPQGPVLAIATSQRRVVLWNFQKAHSEKSLGGFHHSLSRLAFTPRGDLLFGERTNASGTACAAYLYREGRTTPFGQRAGSLTALEAAGDCQAVIAGRDHSLELWDLSEAPRLLRARNLDFWAREARVSPDGQAVALLHKGVSLLGLPNLEITGDSTGKFSASVGRCAAFTPQGEALAVGMYNGEVVLFQGPELHPLRERLAGHAGRVEGLEVLKRQALLVSAAADGEVQFNTWDGQAPRGRVHSLGEQLTSLHISPDEAFMALGDSNAALSLWDLRVLDVPRLFTRPFAQSLPDDLAALQALTGNGTVLPARVRNVLGFMEAILRYRFRFDIEIGEMPVIKVGEYEIELD